MLWQQCRPDCGQTVAPAGPISQLHVVGAPDRPVIAVNVPARRLLRRSTENAGLDNEGRVLPQTVHTRYSHIRNIICPHRVHCSDAAYRCTVRT